ncbi:MAG: hypothetical protein SFU25_00450 [Candidatus Caenarcaniphilales bacterium]|nr:hypothetical protein [Candidatus Caenarcaniphilales bacterium]
MSLTSIKPITVSVPQTALKQIVPKPCKPLYEDPYAEFVGRIKPWDFFLNPGGTLATLETDTTIIHKGDYGRIGITFPGGPYFKTSIQQMVTDLSEDRLSSPVFNYLPPDRAREIVRISRQNIELFKQTHFLEQEIDENLRSFPKQPCYYWGMNIGGSCFGTVEQYLTEGRQTMPSVHPHMGAYDNNPEHHVEVKEDLISKGSWPTFSTYNYGEQIGKIIFSRMQRMLLDEGASLAEIDRKIVSAAISPRGLTLRFERGTTINGLMEDEQTITDFLMKTSGLLNQLVEDVHQSFYPEYRMKEIENIVKIINGQNPMTKAQWKNLNKKLTGNSVDQVKSQLEARHLGSLFEFLEAPYERRLEFEKSYDETIASKANKGNPVLLKTGTGVIMFEEFFDESEGHYVTEMRLTIGLTTGHRPFIELCLNTDMEREPSSEDYCGDLECVRGEVERNRNQLAYSQLALGLQNEQIPEEFITPAGWYTLKNHKPFPVYKSQLTQLALQFLQTISN